MATPKVVNDDSVDNGGPVDIHMARFIRAEVEAAIQGAQETLVAPPSYDSSAPLLASSASDSNSDPEAQLTVPSTDESSQDSSVTFLDWIKFIVAMHPIFVFILLWPILTGTGIDPLALSLLAFFLVIILFFYVIFVCLISDKIGKGIKSQEGAAGTEAGKSQSWDWKQGLLINLGILGFYLSCFGVLWVWSVLVPTSPYRLYYVSRDFQAKIDAPDALASLTGCLHHALPDRNATIADISVCLKNMGMKESFVG